MAKLTYEQLTNRVLGRISEKDLTTAADGNLSYAGRAKIIGNLLNEAQTFLFNEADWYSLYKSRYFTVPYINATSNNLTFTENTPSADTITSSPAVFTGLVANMDILVGGTTSNDGIYTLDSASVSTLTLISSDDVTPEIGTDGTINTVTYPVASDYGRTIDLMDVTNNIMLYEDYGRIFDADDPDLDTTGTPTSYSFQNDTYRFNPIPAGSYKYRERYWAQPTAFSIATATTQTSDLPIECENLLIIYAYIGILEFIGRTDEADRQRMDMRIQLKQARVANKRKLDVMRSFRRENFRDGIDGIRTATLGSRYPAGF